MEKWDFTTEETEVTEKTNLTTKGHEGSQRKYKGGELAFMVCVGAV